MRAAMTSHTRKITVANWVSDTAGLGIDRDG